MWHSDQLKKSGGRETRSRMGVIDKFISTEAKKKRKKQPSQVWAMLYKEDFQKQLDIALAGRGFVKPPKNALAQDVKLYNDKKLGSRSELTKMLWEEARKNPDVLKKVMEHKAHLDQESGLCDTGEISGASHAPGRVEPNCDVVSGNDGTMRDNLALHKKQRCVYQAQITY